MSNGWNWIAEGRRISAEARRLAGLKEGAMAESIVFNHQMVSEGDAFRSEEWALGTENTRLRRENLRLRAESRHQYDLAQARAQRIFELQGEIARLREAQPKSVAALREALVLLGESV